MNFLVQKIVFRREQQHFNNNLKKMGLPVLDRWVFDAAVFYSDVYLQGTCPSFEYPNRDLPPNVQFVGPFNLTTPVHDFPLPSWWGDLQTAKRVVLVTQGTLANEDFNQLMIPAIKALANKDVLVVATTGNKPLINLPFQLPDNVRVEKFIPYSLLMPHLDVMVTNAGYGGVHYAIQHGVPLIVWGKSEDKSEVSARVEWSGIGISLKLNRVTPEEVGQAVDQIFANPSFKQRVNQLQEEIETLDAYSLSIQCLENMASSNCSDTAETAHEKAFIIA
ncbi:glycosyltransferase family 1 protein [Paenibacillus aceris]|uniref:glycosyltransferase n=1 Tax=Paenibacillus aceris TaxID=869555 RepID=UPI0014228C0C|nr:glycosyltransferase [Paenibacillus aceris]NHW36336.1 glycosyltransferase family 1 protein [Paenibacillus aceris]